MRRANLQLAALMAMTLPLLSSCGARLKSADQVSGIFSGSGSLGNKVDRLCGTLRGRTVAPYLKDIGLSNDACAKAGEQAQDLKLSTNIGFSAIRSDGQKFSTSTTGFGGEQTQRLQTRVELWLNRNILGIVSLLLPMLNDKSKLNSNQPAKEEDFAVKVIGEPEFDAKEFKLKLQLELSSRKDQNGQVDIFNRVEVNAQLFDKKFGAATVETLEDTPKEKSFIKSARILVLMVPHAGDIYLDIVTDMTLHSFGVDEAVKEQFLKILSDLFKKIPALVDEAEQNAKTNLNLKSKR